MSPPHNTLALITRLWHHINSRRKRQFFFVLILMVLASFAEILSIGTVLPFLGVLMAPSRVFELPAVRPYIMALGLTSADQLLLPLTIAFGIATFAAGALRLLLLWASTRLSFATGTDLSIDIYRRTLYQPYAVHIARNSSAVISGISMKTWDVIYCVMLPILNIISASILMFSILIILVFIDPIAALAAFAGFGMIYAFVVGVTRRQLQVDSQRVADETTRSMKFMQEGLGGIRDILLNGSQVAHCQIYQSADIPLRRAQGNILFIGASPRYGMEALGMVLITALAYALARRPEGVARAIPVLGALALGAQRLLPILQQAYAAWTNIQGGQGSLRDSLELLDQPLPDYADHPATEPIPYHQGLCLKELSFSYSSESPRILNNIHLNIPKGSRIGFIGVTGSGKSTLLDIIMGLLQPTSGALAIDGTPITPANQRGWQSHIAHVPQAIFLADATIEENIAFGLPKHQIDHARIRLAASQAQISSSIESWPLKYQTLVGERGVRLSGGQRQRLGIARALYKQADVIIFDEATSALDNETEQAVMEAIEGLSQDLTILIIAHRLSTLKNCTRIVELGEGGIVRIGSYNEIISQAAHPIT